MPSLRDYVATAVVFVGGVFLLLASSTDEPIDKVATALYGVLFVVTMVGAVAVHRLLRP